METGIVGVSDAIGMSGHEDDRRAGLQFFDKPGDFDSVQTGHLDVEQDKIRVVLLNAVNGAVPVLLLQAIDVHG